MFTVSGVVSVEPSFVAVRVMVATVSVVPVFGPVNTTLALPVLRLRQVTPAGKGDGQASV